MALVVAWLVTNFVKVGQFEIPNENILRDAADGKIKYLSVLFFI